MNKVILMGRLAREPEVRYSQGTEPLAIARYTLAVNRRFKRQGEPEADFINCVAFGSLRRNISKKGRWFLLSVDCRCVAGMTTKAKNGGQRRLSLRSSILLKESRTVKRTAEVSQHRNRTGPRRHRISLQSRWDWRIALGFIPLTKV